MLKAAQAIKDIAGGARSNAQTALQFALAPKVVANAVVGIRTVKQLGDAVATLDVPQLTNQELDLLKSSIEPNLYGQHR